MSNKGQLLQDPFLNALRKEHIPVSIYLVNGIKLQGQIESFDQYVVLLQEHRDADGLQARHLDRRAGAPGQPDPGVRVLTVFQVESEPAGRAERALLVSVAGARRRPDADAIAELSQLVSSAGLEPVGHLEVRRERPDPAHYVGSGKVDEIRRLPRRPTRV